MKEFNGRMIVSLIGAVIFLFALMGRAFITSIGDMYIAPKVEMYIGKVVDVDKNRTYYLDTEGRKVYEYTTNFVVENGNETLNFTSKKYDDYMKIKVNNQIRFFKYKDKYALSQEEFTLPPVLKNVLTILIIVGGVLGIYPWMPDRYGNRHRSY